MSKKTKGLNENQNNLFNGLEGTIRQYELIKLLNQQMYQLDDQKEWTIRALKNYIETVYNFLTKRNLSVDIPVNIGLKSNGEYLYCYLTRGTLEFKKESELKDNKRKMKLSPKEVWKDFCKEINSETFNPKKIELPKDDLITDYGIKSGKGSRLDILLQNLKPIINEKGEYKCPEIPSDNNSIVLQFYREGYKTWVINCEKDDQIEELLNELKSKNSSRVHLILDGFDNMPSYVLEALGWREDYISNKYQNGLNILMARGSKWLKKNYKNYNLCEKIIESTCNLRKMLTEKDDNNITLDQIQNLSYKKGELYKFFNTIVKNNSYIKKEAKKLKDYFTQLPKHENFTVDDDICCLEKDKALEERMEEIKKNILEEMENNRLEESKKLCECLVDIIYLAVKKAFEQYQAGKKEYNMAPFWYVRQDCISWALPLYISHQKKPDCAAIINKDGVICTILKMNEVYQDIRVFNNLEDYTWIQNIN